VADSSFVVNGPTVRPAALAGIRVLDISGPIGNYCGKLFADMGADVILIEPPTGTQLRFEPPFLDDTVGLERSLSYAYHNTSKRGITLDLGVGAGQDIFRRLVTTADIVLETEKPEVMQHRELDYEALARLNPRIVLTSITPFGQTGPYAEFEAEDLIGLALGGLLYMGGYLDSAPTRVHGNQAYLGASMFGAVATMLAALEAECSGVGQHIDVSMQECVSIALENAAQTYDLEGTVRKRPNPEQRYAGYGVFECKDGYIYLGARGIGRSKAWDRSLSWYADEGMVGVERLYGPEWSQITYLKSEEARHVFGELFMPWAKARTKAYLYHEGQRRKIPLAPVNCPADLLANPQLKFREHFVSVKHVLRDQPLLMPGAPYKLSETPWHIQRPAPKLGEHNIEVYREIGVGLAELSALISDGVV